MAGHEHGKGQNRDDEKGHGHGGHSHAGHAHSTKDKKTLVYVMLLSGSYMVAEIVGGLMSGSLALLADAGHMALDTVAVMLGLFAIYVSQRPPTQNKTFGYYRAEILAALLNAATLIAASVWILYEAYERLSAPPEVQGKMMAIVAVGGLVVNIVSIALMVRSNRDSLNMKGVWLHLLQDALGSVAAIVAAVLVWQFQWYLADPIISAVIGLLILRGAWKLLANCINVLLVAVPDGVNTGAIKKDIEAVEGVKGSHDLHVWALNTGANSLTCHILLADGSDPGDVLKAVTLMLREKHEMEHVTIQIEPAEFQHQGTHFCAPGRSFHMHPSKAHSATAT